MRVRTVSVSYHFGTRTSEGANVERRYQELRDAMMSATQGYAYLPSATAWRPPMDIHETADAILIKIEVAGVREDDLELALHPNALIVNGVRRDDADHDEELCFHAAQVRYGPFHVAVALPSAIRQEEASATYRDGFLRVHLPKVTHSAPRGAESLARGGGAESGGSGSRWQALPQATGTPSAV